MKTTHPNTALVLAVVSALALTGCGAKTQACKLAEQTEAEVLSAWREGGMAAQAEQRRGIWAANMEAIRQSNQGPAQTIQGFKTQFSATAELEEDFVQKLVAQNGDMKAGKPVAENGADLMRFLFMGPKDGKTPKQRAADYTPRIAENEQMIEAHKKAAAICRKAVAKLQGMS